MTPNPPRDRRRRRVARARRRALAAVAAGACLAPGAPAHALSWIQRLGPYTETRSASVATDEGVERSVTQEDSASRTFLRFNPAAGVLTSATLTLASQVTASGAIPGVAGGRLLPPMEGQGSGTATLSGPGFSVSQAPITHATSCGTDLFRPCAVSGGSSRTFFDIRDLPVEDLLARGGETTFAITHGFRNEAAITLAPSIPISYVSDLTWSVNSLTLRYDYLLHAAPSFAQDGSQMTLDLDFGAVLQGDTASLGFSLFDNSPDPREGMPFRLVDLQGSGDTTTLRTDLPPAYALPPHGSEAFFAPGESRAFNAFLDTSRPGDFLATYRFELEEIAPDPQNRSYGMTLNLRGTVLAPAAAVPEPATWATMILGFAAVGAVARRRRLGPTPAGSSPSPCPWPVRR